MTPALVSTTGQKTRLGSFIAGLGGLVSFRPAGAEPLRYPHRDEADALRGDGLRIGNDLRGVIARERARAQAKPE
ncbi:hypothetical protein [uncultured Methylobacterium sp.]|uniref:hypothetical protein n=1 Tax=uncultured Methylobacterium sp. TaxID=157278 RepID=UPI0035CA8128